MGVWTVSRCSLSKKIEIVVLRYVEEWARTDHSDTVVVVQLSRLRNRAVPSGFSSQVDNDRSLLHRRDHLVKALAILGIQTWTYYTPLR